MGLPIHRSRRRRGELARVCAGAMAAALTSEARVRKRLPSSPSTKPKPTWLTRGSAPASAGRMPALRAAAKTCRTPV